MVKREDFRGEKISRLGMGNMRLPTGENGKIDYARAGEILDELYEAGVNYYDTAYPYHGGESEKFLGEHMKKYPRESFNFATKYILSAGPDYKAVFEEQLSRLKTDYIDFYLIHALSEARAEEYINSGSVAYFAEQRKKGRIRYFGFSSHAPLATLERFIGAADWDFAQIQMNYFDWTYQNAKEQYELLTKNNIPVIVMEPLRGGRLTSLTPETEAELRAAQPNYSLPDWGFRWLMRQKNVRIILSGMSSLPQAKENIRIFSDCTPLSDSDAELLMKVCESFRRRISVPCTSCRYCCPECPLEINIPEMLGIYNRYKLSEVWNLRATLEKHEKSALDCVGCGACAAQCPQSIAIPEVMRELAEAAK